MSDVSEYRADSLQEIAQYFRKKLQFETDCADVHAAFATGDVDFTLIHAVGSEEAFLRQHIPGAIHFPHRQMTEANLADWDRDRLYVVYCAGPHCNGADRAAMKMADLGFRVKVMIGGLTGWADEGYAFAGE